jgi:hypothetical protein
MPLLLGMVCFFDLVVLVVGCRLCVAGIATFNFQLVTFNFQQLSLLLSSLSITSSNMSKNVSEFKVQSCELKAFDF